MKEKIFNNPFGLAWIILVIYIILTIISTLVGLTWAYMPFAMLIVISSMVWVYHYQIFWKLIDNKLRNITSLIVFIFFVIIVFLTSIFDQIQQLDIPLIVAIGLVVLWAALPGAIVHTFLLKWSKMGLQMKNKQDEVKNNSREKELDEKTVV